MKNFALIGAAGYIAPRHMKAIKDTGNELTAVLDKNDSVGIIDSYFPDASFFTEFERFDRHVEKMRRGGAGQQVDFVSICSPNYLHDAHIRFALRVNADAICEKPVVLNPWNVEALEELEKESGRRVNCILQLRLQTVVQQLKAVLEQDKSGRIHDVDVTYITPRGRWYGISWKGSQEKAGGIATNIGIHFFDVLIWLFGGVKASRLHVSTPLKSAGYLELKRARIRWFLSLDGNDMPRAAVEKGERSFRAVSVDGASKDLSDQFSNLHTRSYEEVLKGNGFSLRDARPSVEVAYDIRNAAPAGLVGEYHPLLKGAQL